MNNNILQEQVMQRVYRIWFWRYLRRSRLARVVFLTLLVAISQIWVSFGDVLSNVRSINFEPGVISKFVLSASMHTELSVQIILVVGIFLATLFLFDFGRLLAKPFRERLTLQ